MVSDLTIPHTTDIVVPTAGIAIFAHHQAHDSNHAKMEIGQPLGLSTMPRSHRYCHELEGSHGYGPHATH